LKALILDTETTGLKDPVPIEIAYEELRDPQTLAVTDTFCQRYNPGKPISAAAIATHHILDEELVGCPPPGFFTLPPNTSYLIGHNIDFDWEAIGKPPVKRICTLALAKRVWPDADGHSIAALMYSLSTDRRQTREELRRAHSASADVEFTRFILYRILLRMPCQTWDDLWLASEQARIPVKMPFGKHKDMPIADLPRDYVDWALKNLKDMDPYLRMALEGNTGMRSPTL